MKKEVKIFLAKDKDNQTIVNASSVPRGNDCNCICIGCGEPLQARQGNHNRHHFSHLNNSICTPETVLHKLAKEIFLRNNKLMLPEDKEWFHYTEVKEEYFLGNQKPDIVIKGPAGTLHIEIAVTHFIDENKLAKITLARYNTLEIDLSDLDYHTSADDLEKILIEETTGKDLVYWNDNPHSSSVSKPDQEWKVWAIVAAIFFGIIWLFNLVRRTLRKKH